MEFTEFIRPQIAKLLNTNLPIVHYWDRFKPHPDKFIAFNSEDLSINNKLDYQYRHLLNRADKVFDYSDKNQEYFPSEFIPFLSNNRSQVEKRDCYIFYGLLTPRRDAILRQFPHPVHYYPKLNYGDMEQLIPGAHVISIGSWNARCNDTFRTTVALDLGANLICEFTEEIWYNEYLKTFGNKIGWIES